MPDETVSETTNTQVGDSSNDFSLSIRVPQDLITMADDAGKLLGLKRSDVIRLSLGRGIAKLLEQLEATSPES